jgi:two-component system, sensor histidine kinase and response regulator
MKRNLVLVVEDSADCAATIEIALAPLSGIEVRVLRTAEEALRSLGEAKLAAVITDIQLPGMDGLELVACLRGDENFSSVPILVISGASDRDAPARALAAGATAFFSKPFSPGAVRQKLEALIDAQ